MGLLDEENKLVAQVQPCTPACTPLPATYSLSHNTTWDDLFTFLLEDHTDIKENKKLKCIRTKSILNHLFQFSFLKRLSYHEEYHDFLPVKIGF